MRLDIDIELPGDPTFVWEYLSDIASHVDWMHDAAAITFTSDSTRGVGTTFDCLTAIGPFRTTDRMEITEWEPGAAMGVRHEGAVSGEGRFELEPTASGTQFRWVESLRLPWYFGGRMGEVVAKPLLGAIWRRNLIGLRRRIVELQEEASHLQDPVPGGLVGSGPTAEVREYGPRRVVKVPRPGHSMAHELEVLQHVHAAGFPCPEPGGLTDDGSLVMQAVRGPTIIEEVALKPWLLRRRARLLADLHQQLGAIEAPKHWRRVGTGTAVVHLDFHPANVRITAEGPMVIDWANAARGDTELDCALTYVILRTGRAHGTPALQAAVAALRRRFADAFLDAAGGDAVAARVREAAELRLLNRDLIAEERREVFALARGELD